MDDELRPSSNVARKKLRVGVVTRDPTLLDAWELDLLRRLQVDDRLELAVLLIADPPPRRRSMSLNGLAGAMDRAAFASRWPASVEGPSLATVLQLPVDQQGLVEEVSVLNLDLLVELSVSIEAIPIRALTRWGGWTFDFCLGGGREEGAGFWEAYKQTPLTHIALLQLPPSGGQPLLISEMGYNTKFSAARNDVFLKARSVSMVMRELRRLATEPDVDLVTQLYQPPPAKAVRWPDILGYLVHLAYQSAVRLAHSVASRLGLRSDMWMLFVGSDPAPAVDPSKARGIFPFRGQLWADPFLFRHDGRTHVFFENWPYKLGKGHISVGRIDGDQFEFLGDAVASEHHLSYPFVFRDQDRIFMIPEIHAADRLEVWRCVEFPLKWELHATALEGRAPVDSSLFHDGQNWWLFTNLSDGPFPDHNSELHIFRIDGPDLKSITEHPQNPVVIGSETARNGGRIFMRNGKIYRPAQRNSHGRYGYGLNVMEITRLDFEAYDERLAHFVSPTFRPGLVGCHHLDVLDDIYIVDGCRRFGGFGRPQQAPAK